jgi:rare lipoprotein A (peptidoglycan hydrolase)
VSTALARRQAALAAVALLAALGAIALERIGREEGGVVSPTPVLAGRWEEAVAGVINSKEYGTTTACDVVLDRETRGVAHPVLPCGVDLVVEFGGREVRTEVIGRGPNRAGREFDLTQALADDLGVEGTQTIRWRFAG